MPLFTQFTITAGFILGGALFIEYIFVYQGLGWLLYNSINQRDYPIMQGVFLLITVSVVVANLVADLVYSKLDPRIGRGGAAGHATPWRGAPPPTGESAAGRWDRHGARRGPVGVSGGPQHRAGARAGGTVTERAGPRGALGTRHGVMRAASGGR